MHSPFCRVSLIALFWAAAASSIHRARAQSTPPADAPTSAAQAETLAEEWRSASSQYDARRTALLEDVQQAEAQGPFRPDWQSLSHYQAPEWFRDAKFGIFVHWGVYSVPAFGSEWYPRNMYRAGTEENKHQVETYGPLTSFGYKDFIPRFKTEHYDPQAWARLFKAAGARYVVPVFEHHDGFAMYNSELSDWTAVKMGPHRDLAGELAAAVRAEGLHLGASSHRIEHDWFMDGGRALPSDVNDPRYAAFYGPAQVQLQDKADDLAQDWTYVSPAYAEDWLARSAEIVQKYHPELIYFDWWVGQPDVRPYLARFAAFYYNESVKSGTIGVLMYKLANMEKHSGVLDVERGGLQSIDPLPWQTDTSVSNKSWGYIEHDTFKTPEFIVHELVDVVSKNGNLLLNVGPRADGTIPAEVQKVLREVGQWLSVNGDAIYGSRPWTTFGEGPTRAAAGSFHDTEIQPYTAEDFRFTTKGTDVFAIEMTRPAAGEAVVRALGTSASHAGTVRAVSLLGSEMKLRYAQREDGLHIELPAPPPGKFAYVYRISLSNAF